MEIIKIKRKLQHCSEFLVALKENDVAWASRLLKAEAVDCDYQFIVSGFRKSAMTVAVEEGQVEMVKLLYDWGCNVNQITSFGRRSLLHVAVANGHTDVVRFLLEHKAKVDAVAADGRSPLFLACYKDNSAMIKMLVDKKANLEIVGDCRRTALMYCCLWRNAYAAEYLIRHGANVNAKDDNENNALLYATHPDVKKIDLHLVQTLIKAGVDVNNVNVDGHSILISTLLRHDGPDWSTGNNLTELFKLLLNNNFDLQKHGFTALFRASKNGAQGNLIEIVELLIRSGCKLSPSNKYICDSVLFHLARHSLIPQIELMFESGLKLEKEPWIDINNKTFLTLPPDIQKLLLRKVSEVPSLQLLCRQTIRKRLGHRADQVIPLMKDFPNSIIRYLVK